MSMNNRCNRCGVDILDDTIVCPLCNSVVKRAKDNNANSEESNAELIQTYMSRSVMYPDVEPKMRVMKFVVKLVVFLSVLIEIAMIILNRYVGKNIRWSAICGAGLAYICFTLIYSVLYNRGHRRKIMSQAVAMMILAVCIDCFIGYSGWSLEYAIPCVFIGINIAVFVLMLVHKSSFQVYLMMQLYTAVLSTILIIVMMTTNVANNMLMAWIAEGTSVLLLSGTLVFGDKKSRMELTRRFRI